MRKTSRLASLALPVTLVALLSGCLPPAPIVTPVPEPTSAPVFESEEEALAAAEEAYREYQSAVDESLRTLDDAGLGEVAEGNALSAAIESVNDYKNKGRRLVGNSKVDTFSLVQGGGVLGSSSILDPTQIYACLDVAGIDVIDSSGQTVLSPDRPTRFPLIVDLMWDEPNGHFLVSNEEVWDGSDFCD